MGKNIRLNLVDLTHSICEIHIKQLVKKGLLPKALLEVDTYTKSSCKSFLERLCEGIMKGCDAESYKTINDWTADLVFSSIVLTYEDYLKAAVHALRLAPKIAATDYGTSRQRDLAQVWTDAIRGFLGEIAFEKWLKERFGIEVGLDFRAGSLEEFLPSDIAWVKRPGESPRSPRLKISIKTTKLQGIWLDIPYAQLEHSDVFVMVRVGVSRNHFIAFLKEISVIRDKIFEMAKKLGIQFDEEEVWKTIPSFTDIVAFVVGFFDRRQYPGLERNREVVLSADGNLKRHQKERYKIVLNKFVGWWNPRDHKYKITIAHIFKNKGLDVPTDPSMLDVEFEGLGEPSEALHFFVSSGMLKRKRDDWENLLEEL